MKKRFSFPGVLCVFFICGTLYAKTLTPSHITVTALPAFGSTNFTSDTVFLTFRCTNHTNRAVPLEISVKFGTYRNPEEHKIKKFLRLPGLASSEVSFCHPRLGKYGNIHWEALSDSGIIVRKSGENFYSCSEIFRGIASSSFRPDVFEYLFDNIKNAPLPVKEWPVDSRAYANPALIILDSKDKIPPAVNEALRLAAARGGKILVLVMGNDPWPAGAGVEIPGVPYEEKIGFGSRVVMRTAAVDTNPRWKEFVRKKHAAGSKGKWKAQYKNLRWHEKYLVSHLAGIPPKNNVIAHPSAALSSFSVEPPPVPLGMLTFLMCCFVVIIGPVNFLVLKKFHAEVWSLVTIPAFSLLFTGVVIGGVFFKEGFSSKGGAVVETVLDQRTSLAAARGNFSLYSPVSVGKFYFNSDDMLNFTKSGRIDGEADSNLVFASSLLRPRMTFDYSVSRSGYCSEKLSFSEKNGTLEVVNGLGVKVDSLYVSDGQGKFFKLGSPLEPGARAVLYAVSKLPAKVGNIAKDCYRATTSKPFFISPGVIPDKYEHKQTIFGRWR